MRGGEHVSTGSHHKGYSFSGGLLRISQGARCGKPRLFMRI